MKIKFYNLKRIDTTEGLLRGTIEFKGEPQGFVKLTGGKLYIKVKDENLKKILTRPYPVTLKKRTSGGVRCHKTVDCHPGTLDHLKAVASGCWQLGYLAEVVE